MEENFRYYAFISYSHKDKKIAQSLKKQLQSYHLPAELLKSRPDLPKNLRPIFIDESNLAATGSLREALRENLDKSKYLIVLCSTSSAKSEYVNDEVSYFIQQGRTDHIVPIIIDGTPHAKNPDEECFPKAILNLPRENEILGFDVRAHGKHDAFLRAIAAMLELEIEHFIDEEKRRRRKRNALFSMIAAAFSVLAGWLIWHNIPHYSYFHSYVYKWEKPIGLFEVKEADRRKMEYTYRFTTLRNKVTKIERVNSAGILVDPTIKTSLTELPMISFVSDRTVEHYDLYGHKVFRKEYSKNMENVDFYCADSDVPYALPSDMNTEYDGYNYNPENSVGQNSGNIIRYSLEYDANGYVVKKIFRRNNHGGIDKKGHQAQDEKGRWGFGYEVDDLGRIITIHSLNKNGEAIPIYGVYAEQIEYDSSPYPTKICLKDKDGNIVLGSDGFAFETMIYDEAFNIIKRSFYDTDGKRTLNSGNISEKVYSHDPNNGFMTSEKYYDVKSSPCIYREGGYFRRDTAYNSDGRPIERSYYGINGERVICSDGYAIARMSYDTEGNIWIRTYADVNDEPAINSSMNTYGCRYSYDDGFMSRVDYLDSKGELMLHKNGFASRVYAYDKEENKRIGCIYLDTLGKKIRSVWGYAEVRYVYDDGNISLESYYDADGNPTNDSIGSARIESTWQDGNLISQKYLDESDKLTMNYDGYSRVENEYDDNGLKIRECYYDSDGKRVILSKGYSAVNYTYDDSGNKISETYYDSDDHYMVVKEDENYFYAKRFEYHENGNVKHIQYLRESDDKYQNIIDSKVKDTYYEYDDHENETAIYHFNGRGEEVDSKGNPFGFVRIERVYDENERLIRILYYRKNENQAQESEEYRYDTFGRVIAVNKLKGNRLIMSERREYDSFGRCIREYYLDDGKKLMIPGDEIDYAMKKVKYDILGYESDIWFYGAKGEPLSKDDRAFHKVMTHDSVGNVLTESYYDSEDEDEPAELSEGFHRKIIEHDTLGREIERYFYDKNAMLIKKEVLTYKGSFRSAESIKTYGSNGEPSKGLWGVFKAVFDYDSYGNICEFWVFDSEDKPCRIFEDGALKEHHRVRSFDAMGNLLSEEYFDENGEPDYLSYSFCSHFWSYNAYGMLSEEIYDVLYEDEYYLAVTVYEYDSEGKASTKTFVYDSDGDLVE